MTMLTRARIQKPVRLGALEKVAAELAAVGVPVDTPLDLVDVEDGRLLEIRARW